MSPLFLFFILATITIPDSPGIINDNQNSDGIIINKDLSNDAQSEYDNGILIVKDSVLQDTETTPTPTTTNSDASSSSGGGGGGGGGSASSENFSNIIKWEEQTGTLIINQSVSFKFNLPIYEILLTGKENEYDVSVRVELLKDKPQKATVKPDDEVTQYFNVITSTKRMKEAIIRFKSNQSSELLKWNESKWIKLDMIENVDDAGLTIPQECIGERPTKICYTYQTDSFSSFAIIKKHEIVPTSTPQLQPTITPIQATTSLLSIQETPKQVSGFTLISLIFILLIIRKIK